jgi:hypothetical protein
MISLKKLAQYLFGSTMLVAILLLASQNRKLNNELDDLAKGKMRQDEIISKVKDSLYLFKIKNHDLNTAITTLSERLESYSGIQNILKQQSLLLKDIQDHDCPMIKFESSTLNDPLKNKSSGNMSDI